MNGQLTIDHLGAKGDGVAETAGGPVYVPFTLPGETVTIERPGTPFKTTTIVEASTHRQIPPCPHFGDCGGCDMQHADDTLYRLFKRDLVLKALARENVEAEVGTLVPCPPASRRRVVLSAQRVEGDVVLGFNAADTNRIVPITVCVIALPAIERALPALRRLASLLVDRKRPLRITVTATATGLDVVVADAAKLSESLRRNAVKLALAEDFARLTVGGETVIMTRPPTLAFDGVSVELPAGTFTQAVASAEAAMAKLVSDHFAGARRIADLFAGCGTFSLRLARESAVHAVEADPTALAALDTAWRRVAVLKAVSTEKRDLYRRPIPAKELKRYDGVVFDPPRAGAEAVAQELAASTVRRVAAVSCNPVTLARDLRILIDGGYRLTSVTPVDQFLWSHHVEVVALLER